MFAWGYELPMQQLTTTTGTVVVPMKRAGWNSWEFDSVTFPPALNGLVPPGEFTATIQRCNVAMRSVFNRYRYFVSAYPLFMVILLLAVVAGDNYYAGSAFWLVWVFIWLGLSPSSVYFYRRSIDNLVLAVNTELAAATSRYPGTSWSLVVQSYRRRALARHLHIEISVNATTATVGMSGAPAYTPQGYAAPQGYGGAPQGPGGYGAVGASTVPPQGYAPPAQYSVATGGYQTPTAAPPAGGQIPPPGY